MTNPPIVAAAVVFTAALVSTQERVDYREQIQPLLQQHCVKCHGAKKQEGELRLDLRKHVFHADEDLWSIVPGDPDFSPVFERISLPADDPDVMPAEGDTLTAEQIELIQRWIEEGADWPESADEVLLALDAKRRAREVIEIGELTEAQRTAEAQALDAVRGTGALAMRIAANTLAVEANFSLLGPKIGDAELATLRGLEPTLVWLNLSRTTIGDAGLETVASLTRLRRLNLSNSAVTDAGLAHLAGLEELDYLNLYGTDVSDAGLASLEGLANLQKLYLWQTRCTDEGAARLAQRIPGITIDLGRAAEAMIAPAADPINETCPVSGKPVDKTVTSELDGERIAFCCEDCKAKFDADPDAFREQLGLPPAPFNEVCPVSGKPTDPAITSELDGQRIAFCCKDCQAKFDADPDGFRSKLGLPKKKAAGLPPDRAAVR